MKTNKQLYPEKFWFLKTTCNLEAIIFSSYSSPFTLWSLCECLPFHCGPRWRWVGWRHSRSSVLPERCGERSPRPSARETAQSCRWPAQVLHTTGCIFAMRDHQHRMWPPLNSNLISAVISSAARGTLCDALRLANKAPHDCLLFFLFDKTTQCDKWENRGKIYTLSPQQDTKHWRNYIAWASSIVQFQWGRCLQ